MLEVIKEEFEKIVSEDKPTDEDLFIKELRPYFPDESEKGLRAIHKCLEKNGPSIYWGSKHKVVNIKTGEWTEYMEISDMS